MAERVYVKPDQRIDVEDFLGISDLGYGNMAQAVRAALAPTYGIIRGGRMLYQAGVLVVLLKQFVAAMQAGPTGDAIPILGDTVLNFNANVSGLPRIDTVSIHYAEATGRNQDRIFVNSVDNSKSSVSTPTRTIGTASVAVTPGEPNANPVAPNTPAGDLLVGYVRIETGTGQIAADKITNVNTSRAQSLYVGKVSDTFVRPGGGLKAYGGALQFSTPADATIVYSGSVNLIVGGVAPVPQVPISVRLFETVSGQAITEAYGESPTETGVSIPISDMATAVSLGVLTQNISLQLHIERLAANTPVTVSATLIAQLIG